MMKVLAAITFALSMLIQSSTRNQRMKVVLSFKSSSQENLSNKEQLMIYVKSYTTCLIKLRLTSKQSVSNSINNLMMQVHNAA